MLQWPFNCQAAGITIAHVLVHVTYVMVHSAHVVDDRARFVWPGGVILRLDECHLASRCDPASLPVIATICLGVW